MAEGGGRIHPPLGSSAREYVTQQGPSLTADEESGGLGLFTDASIPADERLISCPFSCAVTPDVAVSAISALYGVSEDDLVLDGKPWDERMLISAYIGLHWVWAENGKE